MKVTLAQYKSGEVVTSDVLNSGIEYAIWVHDMTHSNDWPLTMSDNRKAFREVFGRKPDWYWRGEFYMHVWVVEHDDDTFLVLTAREKGTCIEIVCPDGKEWPLEGKGLSVVSFVQDLHNKLKAVGVTK